MGAVARGFKRPGQTEEGRWYYGKERLIDVYFDPTGYTVGDNVLYLAFYHGDMVCQTVFRLPLNGAVIFGEI
jgi:hypothetical protein